jgi:hypothetical protein
VPTVLLYKPEWFTSCAALQSRLLEFAGHLLDICLGLQLLSASTMRPLSALDDCTLPAGRLAVATLQCLSTCLDKLPAQAAAPNGTNLDYIGLGMSHNMATKDIMFQRPSNCGVIATTCVAAAVEVAGRAGSQEQHSGTPGNQTTASSLGSARQEVQSEHTAAGHATDTHVLECLFTVALAMLHTAGKASTGATGGSSSGQQWAGMTSSGATTASGSKFMAGSQCYAQCLSLLGYSKKLFSHCELQADMMTPPSRCKGFVRRYERIIQTRDSSAASQHQTPGAAPAAAALAACVGCISTA